MVNWAIIVVVSCALTLRWSTSFSSVVSFPSSVAFVSLQNIICCVSAPLNASALASSTPPLGCFTYLHVEEES